MYDWYHFTKTGIHEFYTDTNLDELPFKMRERQQREVIESFAGKTDENLVTDIIRIAGTARQSTVN